MKAKFFLIRSFIILFAFFWTSEALFAQSLDEKEVPTAVTELFKRKFRTATDVSWEMKGDNYAVNFIEKKKKVYAEFLAEGKLHFTQTTLKKEDLKANITDYIKKNFRGYEYKAVYFEQDAKRKKTFRIELIPRRWNDEYTDPPVTTVIFNATGRLENVIEPNLDEDGDDSDKVEEMDIPEDIRKIFIKRHKRVSDVQWNDVDTAYYITFTQGEKKGYAIINKEGVWRKTTVDYAEKFSELHPGIQKYFDEQVFVDFKFDHATETLEPPKEKYFSVFVYEESEDVDSKDELELTEYQFSKSGKHVATFYPDYSVKHYTTEENKNWDKTVDETEQDDLGSGYGEQDIKRKDLPTAAQEFLNETFDHQWKTEICRAIEDEDGSYYWVVMKKQGREEQHEFFFDIYGNKIKK